MIAAFSIAGLAGGTVFSCFADYLPFHRKHGELLGGVCLVAGLALIGFGLSPIFR